MCSKAGSISHGCLLPVNEQEYTAVLHHRASLILAPRRIPASAQCVLYKPTYFQELHSPDVNRQNT